MVDNLMSLVDLEAGDDLSTDDLLEDVENPDDLVSNGEMRNLAIMNDNADFQDFDQLDDLDLVDDSLEEVEDDSNVDISSIDFKSFYQQDAEHQIQYPSILVLGIDTEEEFSFFQKISKEGEISLPFYTLVEDIPVQVGFIPFDLHSFLELRFIDNYKVYLLKSQTDKIQIDIDNPDSLLKLIRL